jgi:hypothetical protein
MRLEQILCEVRGIAASQEQMIAMLAEFIERRKNR